MSTRLRLALVAPLSLSLMLLLPSSRVRAVPDVPGFHAPVALPGSGGGTEPSLAVALQDRAGIRFASWQVPGEVATSLDGVHFTNRGFPDAAGGGDVTNAIDPSGALFLGQFCGGAFELHACLQRSVDGGATWPLRTDFADMHPGAADRPWIEVFPHRSEDGSWDPDRTRVYLEYHTFTPEELAYVTVSEDGGRTFSEPKLITSDTNALVGSGCNTIPGGIGIDENDGTVYALWLSGNDVGSSVLTGCNYSQIGPFNKAWVSTSTDGGLTWTAHLAWQGAFDPVTKIGDNADKIFPTISVDRAGQVHVALPVRHNDDPLGYVAACELSPNTCAERPQDTDLLLVTSPDKGAHWTPSVSVESGSGSYFFPWIAAGSEGIVNAIYYKSATRQPNRRDSVWYIGFSRITGAVATYSGGPNAAYAAPPQADEVLLDLDPVHGNGITGGGICTFGLFCAALGSQNGNRSLADSIAIALDPAGGANAAWTDDGGNPKEIHFSCQDSGPSALAGAPRLNGCYGPADLSVQIADSPDPVLQGGELSYRVTVTNSGAGAMPSTTSGVTLAHALPAEVALVSAQPSAGSCSGSSTIACDLGILPGGASVSVDVLVTVAPQFAGQLTSNATVSAHTDDPNPANNADTETTAVLKAADLSVVQSDSPDPARRGHDLAYVVTVTNLGPSAASGVTLTDALPKSAGFGAAFASQGSCALHADKTTVSCALGDLASGAAASVTVVVKPTSKGTIANTATVTASLADPSPSNNTDVEQTGVLP